MARFQRRCGLFLVEAAHHGRERTRASTGHPVHGDKPRGELRDRWDARDNNSARNDEGNGPKDAGVSLNDHQVTSLRL